jgi:glycosyltransferase involved in cell wall biosynthesis
MRIAFCITELNVGGAERCLVELATRLDRSRFDPFVCCLGPRPRQDAASLVNRLEAAQVPVRFFDARGLLSAPRVFWQLRREMRSLKPDVVQTFLWHANVLGVLAARAAGVPQIVMGLRVAEPRRRWRWRWERFAGRWADRHVAVSEGVAAFARDKLRVTPERVVVIPNGVHVPAIPVAPVELASLGVPADRRAIAFVGRLDRQKGIDWFIEQTPQLFALVPHHDLIVVGAGPLETNLRTCVRELRVADRVRFTGWCSDVATILAACDLLVAPSQWEGMSNAVMEAMAAGRPVVAFDVEGMLDAIGDAESPQIVPRNDHTRFIERVGQIAADAALRASLGMQNRARVGEHFRIDQMVAQYEQLFEGLKVGPRK